MGESNSNYHAQRRWADKFLDRQLGLLATLFNVDANTIRLSTPEEDVRDGVDCYIGRMCIGLRVRKAGNPHDEFTVRLHKNRHGKNELMKIKGGHIDHMLYCHADKEASRVGSDSDGIDQWMLLDMGVVRRASDQWFEGVKKESHDHGGHCHFTAFGIDSIGQYGPIVAARGETTTTTHTAADGTLVTTTTTTRAIHPSFRGAAA